MRAFGILAASLLPLAAVAAHAEADAGPQPGDVDESFPIVQSRDPQVAPGKPAPPAKKPAPTVDQTPPVANDAAGHASATSVAPVKDPAAEAPAPAEIAPQSDEARPTPEHVAPRPDPDAKPKEPTTTPPPKPLPATTTPPAGIGFGGVPAINYDSDNGFGFGVVATAFLYDGFTRPYRAALTLQIFMTSKLVQEHNLQLDWLDVGDLPLRLSTRVGYDQSLTQNYCGLGGTVTCDPAAAAAAARTAGLSKADAEDFERHYYERRYINPYVLVNARYMLVKEPARFELTAGYRGFYFVPGTWDDNDHDKKPDLFPYPGSLYAVDHPDGEPGFDSVLSLGFMFDTRDNEPAPTEGIWLEASVREATKLIGSSWDWTGGNLTLRAYAPLMADHKLVWANRFVVDAVIGDPPIQELARVGGSSDYYVYGGSEDGRGIRAQRYLGKLRIFDQNEVRWRFFDLNLFDQDFGFTAAGFVDVGMVGLEVTNPGPMDILPGFGGALRLSWNENFVVRFDLGVSPIESYAPALYITIGNPF